MVGLNWTFEDLAKYVSQYPFHLQVQDLNPIIKQLLIACPGSSIFGFGGHSVVLCISPDIAAKVCLQAGDERLRNEQEIFELLDQSGLECPQLIQCFFRGVDIIFLELLPDGTLHDRISISKPRPILQWMLQLSSAAASLEALGYAHGDINPANILLDANDQVKLVDFDHSLKVGDGVDVGYEPYVRHHREIVGSYFGIAGPITEQFALGSVFWYITRGSEVYSELEGHERVDRMLDSIFPTTNPQDPIDRIIGNCWNGYYPRISDLVDDIKNEFGVEIQGPRVIPPSRRYERRRLCEKYYSLINPSYKPGKAEGGFRSEENGDEEPLATTITSEAS